MAGILGPTGIGGGLLALAGGLKGAGEGAAFVGSKPLEHQQQLDMAKVMNDLATQRETTIERLRFQHGMKEKEYELRGRAGIAQFQVRHAEKEAATQRTFAAGESEKARTSKEKIAETYAGSRVEAARLRAEATGRGKAGKEWEVHSIKLPDTIDPVTHQPVGGSTVLAQFNTRLGMHFIPVGPDKMMPYVASPDGKLPDPGTTRRVSSEAIADLVRDPMGRTPSGNLKSDVFLQRNGYLPSSYFAAVHQTQGTEGGGVSVSASTRTKTPGAPMQKGEGSAAATAEGDKADIAEGQDNEPELPDLPGEAQGGEDETSGSTPSTGYSAIPKD